MEYAATRRQDDTVGAPEGGEADRAAAVAMLDGLELRGPAAFERDCLSFMMEGWPPSGTLRSDGPFTRKDLDAQFEDFLGAAGPRVSAATASSLAASIAGMPAT